MSACSKQSTCVVIPGTVCHHHHGDTCYCKYMLLVGLFVNYWHQVGQLVVVWTNSTAIPPVCQEGVRSSNCEWFELAHPLLACQEGVRDKTTIHQPWVTFEVLKHDLISRLKVGGWNKVVCVLKIILPSTRKYQNRRCKVAKLIKCLLGCIWQEACQAR